MGRGGADYAKYIGLSPPWFSTFRRTFFIWTTLRNKKSMRKCHYDFLLWNQIITFCIFLNGGRYRRKFRLKISKPLKKNQVLTSQARTKPFFPLFNAAAVEKHVYLNVTDKKTDVWFWPLCICAQIFCPKKTSSSPIKNTFQIFFWLLFTLILCNFSVQTLKYFQKNLN